jgi:hypothetical protein
MLRRTALEKNWTEYFWSHEDVVVFSFEQDAMLSPTPSTTTTRSSSGSTPQATPTSLYQRAAAILAYLRQPETPRWANHFFSYDHLTLVNRDAVLDIGGWDTHIPYYASDCDMYDRLMWAGYWNGESSIGLIFDVSSVFDDVSALLRIPGVHASFPGDPGPKPQGDGSKDAEPKQEPVGQKVMGDKDDKKIKKIKKKKKKLAAIGSILSAPELIPEERKETAEDRRRKKLVDQDGETWEHLVEVALRMEDVKYNSGDRNTWQGRQTGGQGEPFYRDPEGFETGLRMLINTGRSVFAEKWGHRGCDIVQIGVTAEDAWNVQRNWDPEVDGAGNEGEDW